MTVQELSREQLIELKGHYYCGKNENVSWGELANIDEIVSDEEIFEAEGGTMFVPDDFFCSMGGKDNA